MSTTNSDTTSTDNTKDQALALLRDTTWFGKCTDDLLDAIASMMRPLSTDDGYMFMQEGTSLQQFLILESGCLARTKLSVSASTDKLDLLSSIRNSNRHLVSQKITENSVLVDTLEGRGRVSGLLHTLQEEHIVYATVTSRGPVKVWLVDGTEFCTMISSTPSFCLQMMSSMSREIRSGTKSLRALMDTLSNTSTSGMAKQKSGRQLTTPQLRVLCYDATSWVVEGFQPAVTEFNETSDFDMVMEYTSERLSSKTAICAAGYDAVCTFVNDCCDADVMTILSRVGVKMVAQRAAGFDRIDTKAARAFGITVARVPAYSPYAVAEMAIALLMAVNRKITKANNRVKMANFTLDKGLLGFDVHGKTVGVMGTGKIGEILCNILLGFEAKLLCYDVHPNESIQAKGGVYVDQDEIYARSDVLFLMMPLLPATKHTINTGMLHKLKRGVTIINTSRGALIDTKALLQGLNDGIISGVGMDVYENESDYFFQDWSASQIEDPDLRALLGEHNVILTAHQAFFTKEAVDKIVSTTIENLRDFQKGMRMMDHPNNCIPAAHRSDK
jgi:D-lactate dehydrogenase